jgi:hypothetical protein
MMHRDMVGISVVREKKVGGSEGYFLNKKMQIFSMGQVPAIF